MEINFNAISFLSNLVEAYKPIFKAKDIDLKLTSFTPEYYIKTQSKQLGFDMLIILNYFYRYLSIGDRLEMHICEKNRIGSSIELQVKGINLSVKRLKIINEQLNMSRMVKEGKYFIVNLKKSINEIPPTKQAENKTHYGIPPYYAEIRKKLKSHFSSIDSLEKMANRKSLEQGIFLKGVHETLERRIEDESLSIEDLCQCLGVSRFQLYRKLTPLTKMSPAHYVKYFRLQRARELLQQTTYSIGQVITMVGFSSQSHFTRAFKEQFGINPSHYKKRKGV